MATRDRDAVAVLRSAIAAIENAEAQPADGTNATEAVLAAPGAAGAGDVARREVDEVEARAIVAAEIVELDGAARAYRSAGAVGAADRVEAQAAVLRSVLGAP